MVVGYGRTATVCLTDSNLKRETGDTKEEESCVRSVMSLMYRAGVIVIPMK